MLAQGGYKLQLEPLSYSNYPTWMPRMEDVLLREGVYSAIEGEDVSTADRNRALGLIRMHVDNSIRADLESAELSTPAKVWAHLKKQYKTTAVTLSVTVLNAFHAFMECILRGRDFPLGCQLTTVLITDQ